MVKIALTEGLPKEVVARHSAEINKFIKKNYRHVTSILKQENKVRKSCTVNQTFEDFEQLSSESVWDRDMEMIALTGFGNDTVRFR